MKYAEIEPSRHLANYVKCYWLLEQANTPETTAAEPVMPDGCLEIIFNLADHFRRYHADGTVEAQPTAIIAGQMRSYALIEPSGNVKLFGIKFCPAGAYPFFRFSLAEMTGRIEALDSIFGKTSALIEEQLNEAANPGECVAIVEKILLKLLAENRKFDDTFERAAELIAEGKGVIPIERIARNLGISGRRLERKFQQRLGLSPKFFSRITRFQNLLNALRERRAENLLGTALLFGYYDQAHLIHEFNEFSGQSPLAFFENEYRFSEFFINSG